MELQTNTHTYTCKRTQAPPISAESPHFAVYCLGPFAVSSVVLFGGWSFVCCLGERNVGERQMERRSEEEQEVLDGPQLVSAIVSMTCSSLLLSLCLLACSSRSKADKIWGGKGLEVSKCCKKKLTAPAFKAQRCYSYIRMNKDSHMAGS